MLAVCFHINHGSYDFLFKMLIWFLFGGLMFRKRQEREVFPVRPPHSSLLYSHLYCVKRITAATNMLFNHLWDFLRCPQHHISSLDILMKHVRLCYCKAVAKDRGKHRRAAHQEHTSKMFSTLVPIRATKICQQMTYLVDLLKPRGRPDIWKLSEVRWKTFSHSHSSVLSLFCFERASLTGIKGNHSESQITKIPPRTQPVP